jgi:exodeoxyribonuclease V
MPLTPHQQEKHDEVIRHYRNGAKRVILNGSAGTGKTYTADEIIKTIKRDYTISPNYNNGTLYACAPTNKALAVLSKRVTSPVEFKTIHSALKLSQYVNPKSGIEVFRQQKSYGRPKGNEFDKCKFALIDEASMLGKSIEGSAPHKEESEDEIMTGYLEKYGMPILYMGDEKQLSPVKEKYSPVFHKDYPIVTLTEIMRQKGDNPIIQLSNDIDLLFFKQPNTVDGKGYVYSNDKQQFIEELAEVNGTDDLKYIAFTNVVIDAVNREVRNRIYTNPNKVELGESIIFNKPFNGRFTNEEVKVEHLEVITSNIPIPTGKTKWDMDIEPTGPMDNIRLKYYRINDEFNIIHEHSEKVFKEIFFAVKTQCITEGWDFRAKKYVEDKLFVDYKYNHAITVHKSQGSTYKQTIINIGNIMFNPSADDRQRMLYTAITRASDLIILNNVK